ncbi:pH-response regulator protein palI/Rim9p [Diutina catenulata]
MERWLVVMTILTLTCMVLQLLPVITVPITGPHSNLYLSQFENYSFGVFGLCDLNTNTCSSPRIGYPKVNDSFYDVYDDYSVAELPSSVTTTISKLLVVHVVGFGISAVQFLMMVSLLVVQEIDKRKERAEDEAAEAMLAQERPSVGRDRTSFGRDRTSFARERPSTILDRQSIVLDRHLSRHSSRDSKPMRRRKPWVRDYAPFMDWMLIFSLVSFLTTLLAFLADILLFISRLSWVGWLQLFPIIALALISTMVCFLKRSISTRKFLEEDHFFLNDDMRARRRTPLGGGWSDDESDDGFFVYTEGLNQNVEMHSLQSRTGASSVHSPRSLGSDDDSTR